MNFIPRVIVVIQVYRVHMVQKEKAFLALGFVLPTKNSQILICFIL